MHFKMSITVILLKKLIFFSIFTTSQMDKTLFVVLADLKCEEEPVYGALVAFISEVQKGFILN